MEIDASVLDAIRRQLARAYPEEACGLLLGRRTDSGVVVGGQILVRNHRRGDGGARNRYLITAEDFRAGERQAAVLHLEIVGAYHSHPDAPAVPSAFDREHAWPWYRYLIASVTAGRVRDARVWELTDDRSRFVEHALRVREQ